MKKFSPVLFVIFVLASLVLSACGAAASRDAGPKVQADVLLTGVIESINGTQWVVNGHTLTVDSSVVREGTFKTGDIVKVEGRVQSDGTLAVTRVEIPDAQNPASANVNASLNDNSTSANSNTNDANINDDNSTNTNSNTNDANINGSGDLGDNSNNSSIGNTNEDHSNGTNSIDDHSGQGGSGGSDDGGGHDANDDNSNGG